MPGGPFFTLRGARADQPAGAFGGDPRYVLAALLSIAAFVFGIVPMLVFKVTESTFKPLTDLIRHGLAMATGSSS